MNKLILPPIAGIRAGNPGVVDEMLSTLARRLQLSGTEVAGAVQQDIKRPDRCRCDMTLHILSTHLEHPISSDLGSFSRGCRLNWGALEQAAWDVEAALQKTARHTLPKLMVINKFSKSESQGKGFLPAITTALDLGIPVLCGIGRLSLEDFKCFSDGHAELLEPDCKLIEQWVLRCLASNDSRGLGRPFAIRQEQHSDTFFNH